MVNLSQSYGKLVDAALDAHDPELAADIQSAYRGLRKFEGDTTGVLNGIRHMIGSSEHMYFVRKYGIAKYLTIDLVPRGLITNTAEFEAFIFVAQTALDFEAELMREARELEDRLDVE